MQREIKFKVWDKAEKQMWMPEDIGNINFQYKYVNLKNNSSMPLKRTVIPFKESLLLEYTGLKDKNGIEIYEGDILQAYDKKGEPFTNSKVYWNKQGYWDSESLLKEKPYKTCYGGFHKCKVIGNKFTTPEILEEGEKIDENKNNR